MLTSMRDMHKMVSLGTVHCKRTDTCEDVSAPRALNCFCPLRGQVFVLWYKRPHCARYTWSYEAAGHPLLDAVEGSIPRALITAIRSSSVSRVAFFLMRAFCFCAFLNSFRSATVCLCCPVVQ